MNAISRRTDSAGRIRAKAAPAIAFAILALAPLPLTAADAMPRDVARFIERRHGCDHFRGEEAYDEERRRFLHMRMKQLCTGTDRELARLKSKYRGRPAVIGKLQGYEPKVEGPRK